MPAKNREETIRRFLEGTKWENAERVDKTTDCSCRRYEYLNLPNSTAILMDCPHSEPIGPFVDVAEILSENHPIKMKMIGVKDSFGVSGTADELYKKFCMDTPCIVKAVKEIVS